MKLQKILLYGCVVAMLASENSAFSDDEIVFLPYLEVGTVDYSLDFQGNFTSPFTTPSQVDSADNILYFDLTSIKGGVVFAYGDFFVNSFYKGTGKDSDLQILPPNSPIKWTGQRHEISISIGYKLLDEVTIFGGYRDSETDGSGTGNSDYTFTQDGFFLGASYYLSLTDTGGLTFSFGNAWLDSEIKQDIFGLGFTGDGDGAGIKFGVAWRDNINENWSYTVSAEYFNYEHDLDLSTGLDGTIDLEETETSFTIGLLYNF